MNSFFQFQFQFQPLNEYPNKDFNYFFLNFILSMRYWKVKFVACEKSVQLYFTEKVGLKMFTGLRPHIW